MITNFEFVTLFTRHCILFKIFIFVEFTILLTVRLGILRTFNCFYHYLCYGLNTLNLKSDYDLKF